MTMIPLSEQRNSLDGTVHDLVQFVAEETKARKHEVVFPAPQSSLMVDRYHSPP